MLGMVLGALEGETMDGAVGGMGYDWCSVGAEIEAANSCEEVVVR
jgi:hypothetical protein